MLTSKVRRLDFGGKNLVNRVKCRIDNLRNCSITGASSAGSPKYLWKAPQGHRTDFSVYNAIAKRKTPLVLERQNVVKWYACGPTVYDHSHIGHAFCYVRFDMIRRLLENANNSVIFAMNITDIDDKIIRRSKETQRSSVDIAREFEKSFFEDLKSLQVKPPSIVLRVTENVPLIVDFIQKLLESGCAYQISDGIYFDTEKDSDYPRFRGGGDAFTSRLQDEKRHFADFVLWKFAKPQEPSWNAPFGAGRPGWHVECSAMASKIFGSSVDIHSGGKDLEFPHHENEEAQSCAYHSCSNWAKFYLHSGHVQIDSRKMSKSLGNVLSIKDYLESGTSDELRMMCLRVPYRSDIHYSDELHARAKKNLAILKSILTDCEDYLRGKFRADVNEEKLLQNLFLTKLKVEESFRDDFDFSEATTAVLDLVQMLGAELQETDAHSSTAYVAVSSLKDFIRLYFDVLGVRLGRETQESGNVDRAEDVVHTCMNFRCDVRSAALAMKSDERLNILKLCDGFREDLKAKGIVVRDKRT
ncbi:probable cysteine--tRNA ligase, mitochondrial [Galendromus occidentalis]|uniref:cysteine--tRNA ligase n=1 Tax=Galendromus occidentalis TaxID=34638 RepID=A0AAJ6VZJ9_9ACAR|nr:probable cysteine--tRNA ligase, mitochondrial [Galendromus occidentalis]